MTPAQELGWKVGDKFVFTDKAKEFPEGLVRECTGFGPYDVLTLAIDDETCAPVFTGDACEYHHGPDGTPGAHIVTDLVQPYKE